jgi:hypothetical protein
LSKDLSWNKHITEVIDKATRRLGIMRKLKYKIDRISLERIYLAFIRPLLEYGDVIWDSPLEVLHPLEAIQRNAARIVVGATARCSTQGLYSETSWEPLDKRRESHRTTLMYKIVHGKAPRYLTDLVPGLVRNRTSYTLRNGANLDPPQTRLNVYANSFFPKTTRLWNELRPEVKNLPSVESFKAHHKRSLPTKNALYYYGKRFEATIHAHMRIGNSPLKADLCDILHVIQSPLCPCGGGVNEDVKHYFFKCPLFSIQRETLASDLLPYVIENVDHLLFGQPGADHLTNIHIFDAVHKYIKATKRFE